MTNELKTELEALHGDLRKYAEEAAESVKTHMGNASDSITSDVERLLHELKAHLTKAGEDTEDLISEHPIAATASAFLLGVAVGRLMGRAR